MVGMISPNRLNITLMVGTVSTTLLGREGEREREKKGVCEVKVAPEGGV